MEINEKIQELRNNLALTGVNYPTQQFLLAYKGDALEAAKAAGIAGTDAALRVRISQIEKHPVVEQYIDSVNNALAEDAVKKAGPVLEAIDFQELTDSISTAKDALDLSSLSEKQKRLIACYQGNLLAAVELAGYAGGAAPEEKLIKLQRACYNVLREPKVKAAIEAIDKVLNDHVVMSVTRAKILLTQFAEDETIDNAKRQTAITTLLKTQGALNDKVIYEQNIRQEVNVRIKQRIRQDIGYTTPLDRLLTQGVLLPAAPAARMPPDALPIIDAEFTESSGKDDLEDL
jgi:phage terminase small subunit